MNSFVIFLEPDETVCHLMVRKILTLDQILFYPSTFIENPEAKSKIQSSIHIDILYNYIFFFICYVFLQLFLHGNVQGKTWTSKKKEFGMGML